MKKLRVWGNGSVIRTMNLKLQEQNGLLFCISTPEYFLILITVTDVSISTAVSLWEDSNFMLDTENIRALHTAIKSSLNRTEMPSLSTIIYKYTVSIVYQLQAWIIKYVLMRAITMTQYSSWSASSFYCGWISQILLCDTYSLCASPLYANLLLSSKLQQWVKQVRDAK